MQPKPWLGAEFLLEFVFAGEIFLSFRDRCSSAAWMNRIKYRECPQIRSNMVFKWSSTYVATRSRSQLVQSGGLSASFSFKLWRSTSRVDRMKCQQLTFQQTTDTFRRTVYVVGYVLYWYLHKMCRITFTFTRPHVTWPSHRPSGGNAGRVSGDET